VRSPFDSAAEHEEMKVIKEHDPALSAPTTVGALSARPRADLEREVVIGASCGASARPLHD